MIDPWEEDWAVRPPGNFGSTPATLHSPSPAPYRATDQPQSDQLNLLPFAEWEEGGEYDEEPPSLLHNRMEAYSIFRNQFDPVLFRLDSRK